MISTIFVKKIKISIDCCVQVNKDILLKIGTKTDIDLTITLLNFTGEAISNCIAYNLSYKKCHFLPVSTMWFVYTLTLNLDIFYTIRTYDPCGGYGRFQINQRRTYRKIEGKSAYNTTGIYFNMTHFTQKFMVCHILVGMFCISKTFCKIVLFSFRARTKLQP